MTTIEFNILVNKASQSLKYPALKFTGNQNDANDLIKETVSKALDNMTKFEGGTNIKAWLYMIMKNTFINNYQKIEKKESLINPKEVEGLLNNSSINTDDENASIFAMVEINKTFEKLDDVFKVPFVMLYSGFKYEEIAKKLSLSIDTVKNRIHVARQILMDSLKDCKV